MEIPGFKRLQVLRDSRVPNVTDSPGFQRAYLLHSTFKVLPAFWLYITDRLVSISLKRCMTDIFEVKLDVQMVEHEVRACLDF